MEPKFRHDFSGVRVHTDTRAVESARAVDAVAYTVGSRIVMGVRQEGAPSRDRIMAHELAHVVQQSGSTHSGSLKVAPSSDPAESQADRAADRVLAGSTAEAPGRSEGRLQRLGANPSCTPAQSQRIHQAIWNANSWAIKALAALKTTPLSPKVLAALKHNFGPEGTAANAPKITSRLQAGRDDMIKNPYTCNNETNNPVCANGNCGESFAGSHASTICTNVNTKGDANFDAGCALHEALHACDASMTADNYSGWFKHSGKSDVYPGGTPLTNADSYTTLAMELS
jgi:hypothetical protein